MTKLQLFIEGVEVDLFKDEIVTVNSSVANVQDISKVFSDFSQSFLVPASPRNNAIFQHWYESDVVPTIDQNLRRDAFIEIETMPFRVGKIQLNEAVIKDGQVVSYSLNFFGALTSLKDRFGELQLKDLDYSSLNFTYNGQAVQDRLEDGTTSYDVRFPLISAKRFWNDITGNVDNIFEATKGISYRELFPAVRVSKIFDFIETQFGITFNSTFFSSTRWTDLYFRNQLSETFNVLSNKHLVSFPNGSVPAPQSSQISINSTTSVITIKEEYRTEVEIINLTRSSGSAKLFVEVYRNDVLFSTTTVETGVTGLTIFATAPSVAINDYQIYIYSDESITVNFDLRFTVSYEGGAQFFDKAIVDPITLVVNDISGAFSSTIKIADFFSAILKTFNLVCVGENETTFTIEPLQDWYGLGTEKDITKYVLNSSGIKKVPLYKQISFSYKESKSFTNKNFLSLFNRQYGNLDASFFYDGSEFKIDLPFENNQFVEIANTNLFCSYCIDENNSSYIPEPMLLYFSGEVTSAFKFKKESTEVNITDYALFNSVNTTGFSLCFGNEFNIVTQETEPNSLYQTYYSNHLGNLYDLQQRLFSFTAMLPTGVLANLKMNDKIIIKDKRYLINDISSTLNNGEVKMNLIRELVTIAPDCECIKVTYTLVGEEPVTVEVNKIDGVGYDIWQILLGEEPNQILIELYYNAGHWVLNFVTETPSTNGLYYAFVENEGCPFVDFSEYELQEGYDLNLESFKVEPCY
jgi:hypothetical protein